MARTPTDRRKPITTIRLGRLRSSGIPGASAIGCPFGRPGGLPSPACHPTVPEFEVRLLRRRWAVVVVVQLAYLDRGYVAVRFGGGRLAMVLQSDGDPAGVARVARRRGRGATGILNSVNP